MVTKSIKLKRYAYDIWVMRPTTSPFPAGTRFIDFEHFPTSDDILEYINNHFSDFCDNYKTLEIAKFYNIKMRCIKFYAANDTAATYYLINNIREINQ